MASDKTFTPGPRPRTVRDSRGNVLAVPKEWELLPPGDATLTRRVKTAGDYWLVQQRRGRRVFSQGVWASAKTIERIRSELDAERSTPTYQRRREADGVRREKKQAEYVTEFAKAVYSYLNFHPTHDRLAKGLAHAVAQHATPVGSGTVARTQRISIDKRAEAAVIAWMRHQTTAYDSMAIPRVKGKRREVRRLLAQRSKNLLDQYRRLDAPANARCPLKQALAKINLPTKPGAITRR